MTNASLTPSETDVLMPTRIVDCMFESLPRDIALELCLPTLRP